MTHNLTEKITLLENQLKQVVEEHNSLVERKQLLFNKSLELQGALSALKEIDHDHADQPAEGEST